MDQGYVFEQRRPLTRDDVSKLMFCPQGKAMAAAGRGDYGPMVAYFMCMAYYITGPKSSTDRFHKAIEMWAEKNEYKMVLGDQTTSGRRMRNHCLVSLVRRKATNSYGTTMSGKLARCCGIRILKDCKEDFQ